MPNKRLKLTGGRQPGFPCFNVNAGGPGSLAEVFGLKTKAGRCSEKLPS
jgi:hypothetical protein